MRKEYDLQTAGLATIVAATSVTKKHSDLPTPFATRTDYRSARYVIARDVHSERPARILDTDDREIAADYHTRGLMRSSKRMAVRCARGEITVGIDSHR
ncbi:MULTISPECIES: hypothetical protein [unclassified Caballeronia]|uniref:hypothetical protein n=1 Tax=unclassified Caballeronia TaxID=2646786 RepID=UPI0032EC1EB0